MNPTMMHGNFPMSYTLPGDFKYHPTDRHYTNASLSNNDYPERRDGLAMGPLSQSANLGGATTGINYSGNQLHHETPCNTSGSLILTPPHSGDESSTTTNPSSSSFSYSTLPKVSGSNVSGSDYYQAAGTGYLPSGFHGANMTQLGRHSALQIPAPHSPPYNHYGLSSNSFPPFTSMASRNYQYNTLLRRNNGTYDPLRPPLGHFTGSLPYPSMHPQPPPRPEGPPFEDTVIEHNLVGCRNLNLSIDVLASIPKGFFRVDDKWTCYRRNYFSVTCGFAFKSPSQDGQVYLQRFSQPEQVHGYAVSITARTAAANNTESENRGLVQHTPKRDKATESVPTRHAIIPSPPQGFGGGHGMPQNGLYAGNAHLATCLHTPFDALGQANGQSSPQTTYTFERIQFQKATANNGKRRAQQQYFHVVIKLEVNVGRAGGPDDWVVVATKQSHPMVVRGRSPGHYKDNRRGSQSSMGPDAGAGHGGDGGPTGYSTHPFGPSQSASMSSTPSYHHPRSSQHYGTSFSHSSQRVAEVDSASASPGSSGTLASSPARGDNYHMPYSTTRTTLPEASFDRIVLSPVLAKPSSDVASYHYTKKRTHDDDASECTNPFYNPTLDSNYHNPSFDFSATSSSQALCA